MSNGITKRTVDSRPSPAERAAQVWHAEQHGLTDDSCWCCCHLCRETNPYDLAARRAAVKDIMDRIADSVSSAKLAIPPGKRFKD